MNFDQDTLEIAIDMLSQIVSKKGDFSFDKTKQPWFLKHEKENDIMEAFNFLAEKWGLIVCERNDIIYLSPGINNSIFGMNNEEIRKRLANTFGNSQMYTSFFIMHVLISEFYRESLPDTHRVFLSVTELIDTIDRKMNAMYELVELENISEDLKFNFGEIRDLWFGLQTAQLNKDTDKFVQFGKKSKYAVINTTLNFMDEQDLIVNSNNDIYLTDRFKAIIDRAYRHKDVNFGITEFITDLTSEQGGKYAED
ncbi:MAG: hypothetical protein E4G94_01360 [ANME-2 cluster archaeon]|nr:MAG: hypothetical protein E4G94_01360 [ANME-2 cluster archaeon]